MKAFPDSGFRAVIDKIMAERREIPKEEILSEQKSVTVMSFEQAFRYLGRVLAGDK